MGNRVARALPLCVCLLMSSVCLLHSAEISALVRRYGTVEILSNRTLRDAERIRVESQNSRVAGLAELISRNGDLRVSNKSALSASLQDIRTLVSQIDDGIVFPIDTTLVKVRLKVNTEESIRHEIHGIRAWYPFAHYEGFLPPEMYLRLVLFNTCIRNEMGAQFVVSDAFRPWTLSHFYYLDPDFGSAGLKAPVTENRGVISRGSRHNKGEAVDVYLIDVTGKCIAYPGQPCYHRTEESVSVDPQKLYQFIEQSKGRAGLMNIRTETTHFQLASGSNAMAYAAEFPGLCVCGKCRNDVTQNGVVLRKNTLVKIMDMNPGQDSVGISVINGRNSGAALTVPRKSLIYPYLPVVAQVMEDIQMDGSAIPGGILLEFCGVGHNDSLGYVQLLNDTLTLACRVAEYMPQLHILPYDSIGVLQGPLEGEHRGSVLRISDANRDWVISFSELRRKQ